VNIYKILFFHNSTNSDILMLWHSSKGLDIIKNPLTIPRRILVNWIEVFDSNFQEFPSYDDIAEIILRTIT